MKIETGLKIEVDGQEIKHDFWAIIESPCVEALQQIDEAMFNALWLALTYKAEDFPVNVVVRPYLRRITDSIPAVSE